MKRYRGLVIGRLSCAMVLAAATVAEAGPCPALGNADQQITAMFAQSQVVAIGNISHTRVVREWHQSDAGLPQGDAPIPMETISSTINVERLYKGESDSTIQVQFDICNTDCGGPAVFVGERALVFLKSDDGVSYKFADKFWSKLDATGITTGSVGTGVEALEHDVAHALLGNQPGAANALDILQEFRRVSPATETRLLKVVAESDLTNAARAYAVLLTTGQTKYFEPLPDFLRAQGSRIPGQELALLSGRIGEFGMEANPAVIARLSTVPIFAIEYVALDVLAELRSSLTVEIVLHHLDDPNPEVRFKTLFVLNRIVNGDNGAPTALPSKSEFDEQPQQYIGPWKDWWEEKGSSQYAYGTMAN